MIRSALFAVAGASFFLISSVASAAVHPVPMDGKELSAGMKTCVAAKIQPEQIADWRACNGYLTGAINGVAAAASVLGQPPMFCIPQGETDDMIQVKLMVYIDDDPTVQAASSIAAIIAGMTHLYPCQPPKPTEN